MRALLFLVLTAGVIYAVIHFGYGDDWRCLVAECRITK